MDGGQPRNYIKCGQLREYVSMHNGLCLSAYALSVCRCQTSWQELAITVPLPVFAAYVVATAAAAAGGGGGGGAGGAAAAAAGGGGGGGGVVVVGPDAL